MAIKLTEKDIAWLKEKYSFLKIRDNFLVGEINFNREFNEISISSSYLLEINLESKQDSILPQVKELEGKIKKIAEELDLPIVDLHINNDDTICLCIYEKEKDYFPNSFSVEVFFEQIVEPYLYWVSYYKKYKNPPWEGYAHFELGYLELFAENEICLENLKKHISLEKLLDYKNLKGHHLCPCGSGKKLRNCHKLLYNATYKLKYELYGQK